MKRVLATLVATGLALVVAVPVHAQDAKVLLEKAVKAHGGKDKLAQQKSVYMRNKGNIDIPGVGNTSFTQETWVQESGKLKDVMQLDIAGMTINVTTVYNGQKIWVNAAGNSMELDQELYGKEIKEIGHLSKLMRLAFIGDKEVETSLVGEAKVEDRPATGIRLTCKGHKDVTLYFDKETGLICKIERMALDPMTNQEVSEERIIKEYQDYDGLKATKKLLLNRDGKKFMELEVLEMKLLDKIDDSEFNMP